MINIDKDFIEACKRAAELRSGIFKMGTFFIYILSGMPNAKFAKTISLQAATQDDIDAMAAAVGWVYQIVADRDEEWDGLAWKKDDWSGNCIATPDEYLDKLTAAKAAWIEIVKQLENDATR